MTNLLSTPVTHPAHVETMRKIYNLTRPALSIRPLPERTAIEQQNWWNSLDHSRVRAWLFAPAAAPWEFIAFSMLQQRDGNFETPLFAIHPSHHGRGYGREIISHYLREAHGMLAGSALKSNEAIMALNDRAGWRQIAEDTHTVYLYHPNGMVNDARQQEVYELIVDYHASNTHQP